MEKGENAGYQHFLLFPQCFQKTSFNGSFELWPVWERDRKQCYFLSEIQFLHPENLIKHQEISTFRSIELEHFIGKNILNFNEKLPSTS